MVRARSARWAPQLASLAAGPATGLHFSIMTGTTRVRANSIALFVGLLALLPAMKSSAQNHPAAATTSASNVATSSSKPAGETLDDLIAMLASDEYRLREAATHRILALGSAVAATLRERADTTADPETRYRLEYILEVITPPQMAVLICRADPRTGLSAGDLIVQANGRRVRDMQELRRRIPDYSDGGALRVLSTDGPHEVVLDDLRLLTMADYRAPRGEVIMRALRDYATGYAERAYDTLRALPESAPAGELSPALLARIAYTAGQGKQAWPLISSFGAPLALRAGDGNEWTELSHLDLTGPGKSPFHLEWELLSQGGPRSYRASVDPDLRVQRVLVPAGRCVDAFARDSALWWSDFRLSLATNDEQLVAGNMLAVIAWMLSQLDLRSECCRLVEPRSEILRRSPRGESKWVRVETDAWLPFLAGDPTTALNDFYDAAVAILRRPPQPDAPNGLIRNPVIAGRIGFFLYQVPGDPRADDVIRDLMHPSHPSLRAYLDWMLYGLSEANEERITRHLGQLLSFVPDAQVERYARALVLLQYVQPKPEIEAMQAVRQRYAAAPAGADRAMWLAVLDALVALTAHQPAEALAGLEPFATRHETANLISTARFLQTPPPGSEGIATLRDLLLAVPLGNDGKRWIVLTRQRRLALFNSGSGQLAPIDRPTPAWFPGPLTWPWLGHEDASGRVWAYGLRRVIELVPPAEASAVRINLDTELIAGFDQSISPWFSRFAEDVATATVPEGETGEFLRADVLANLDFVPDPNLPELAFIAPVSESPRYLHAAMRGGANWLTDLTLNKTWSTTWVQRQLGLSEPLRFIPLLTPRERSALGDDPGQSDTVWLASNLGLLRLDSAADKIERMPLPGTDAFPALVPESTPYVRRDPRWVYFARLPQEGGQVYRVRTSDGVIEAVDMVNESLPPAYYVMWSRAELRRELSRQLERNGIPELNEFLNDAIERVKATVQGDAK